MSKPTPVQYGLFLHLDEEYLVLLQALQITPQYQGHSLEAIAAAVVYRRALELGVALGRPEEATNA
jgi:hypothetical protein